MHKYNIEEIQEAINKIEKFNSVPLENLILYENGSPITLSENIIKYFKFIGLNNKDFVKMRFWENSSEFLDFFQKFERLEHR